MPQSDIVTVTQADRDAAADLAAQFQRYTHMQIEAPAIRRGEHDDWEFVQAFARHRIRATDHLPARDVTEGMVERAAKVLCRLVHGADAYWESYVGDARTALTAALGQESE